MAVRKTSRLVRKSGSPETNGTHATKSVATKSAATPGDVKDPKLAKGKTVVDVEGTAPTRTTATRKIYSADGDLIRSETWTTSYEGETRVVRVGTKVVAKPKTEPGKKSDAESPTATDITPTMPRP